MKEQRSQVKEQKPGEGTEKPDEGTEKPDEGTEKPGEGTEKPGEGTEKPGEGVEKPNLPEKGQGSSNNQQLPATGHNTNYVPFIGFMLLLLGIRLRFMAKIAKDKRHQRYIISDAF